MKPVGTKIKITFVPEKSVAPTAFGGRLIGSTLAWQLRESRFQLPSNRASRQFGL
jgi:hypothetical protein